MGLLFVVRAEPFVGEEVRVEPAESLTRRDAVEPLCGPVHVGDPPIRVDRDHGVIHLPEHQGLELELFFHPFPPGDVPADPEQVADGAVAFRHRDEACLKPGAAIVPGQQGLLGEGSRGWLRRLPEHRNPPLCNPGRKHLPDVHPLQRPGLSIKQAAAGTVHVEGIPFHVDQKDDIRRRLRKRPVALLALPERLFHAPLLGDIDRGGHDADWIPGPLGDDVHVYVGGKFCPVGPPADQFSGAPASFCKRPENFPDLPGAYPEL